MTKHSLLLTRRHVEWLDALYLLGLYVFMIPCTYLHSWFSAYKTGNISETVEDQRELLLTVYIHWLSIAAKMYDLE